MQTSATKAIQLYIQYDKSYASVFRELGYPSSSHSIKLWYKEYEETGDLHKSYISSSKYSNEQRKAAVSEILEDYTEEEDGSLTLEEP